MALETKLREEVVNRLRRIEGQVRGIQRLVEQGADCRQIASQVKAARTALDAAGKLVLACHLTDSLASGEMSTDEAVELIMKF